MFFADNPYISDFFRTTVRDNNIPVVKTDITAEMDLPEGTRLVDKKKAVEIALESENPIIYSTSENAIGWISDNLSFTSLPEKIELFKNKIKFRKLISPLFPGFFFREIQLDQLMELEVENFSYPFIIKPAVGFFSMGVFKVSNSSEWETTVKLIKKSIAETSNLYPMEVLDTSSFIIEEMIEGDEFAVDAYFDSSGEAVILSILHHTFSSEDDVSDRVYTTSKRIIEENLSDFAEFVNKLGDLSEVRNFPVHIELRRDKNGIICPIEVNPMRFGGWCTTADITFAAYGFNPYLYYYNQQKPNWREILKEKNNNLFSIIVLDNSTGVETEKIESFDYSKVMNCFNKPLELRKIDYSKYPVFGFIFTETEENNFRELKYILDSDLREFIKIR